MSDTSAVIIRSSIPSHQSVRIEIRIPVEVWTLVFTYLPLRDRKNARLVNRDWNDVINVPEILRKEKLVCFSFYRLEDFFQTIANSRRKILNLEFQRTSFKNFCDLKFWKEHGQKVESLKFKSCKFSYSTLPFIVNYCDQLRSLSLNFRLTRTRNTDEEAIIRPFQQPRHLHSIKIEAMFMSQLSDEFLWEIFTMYRQNIRNVSLLNLFEDVHAVDNDPEDESNDREVEILTKCPLSPFSTIFTNLQEVLESITIGQRYYKVWRTILQLTFPKLRKLRIVFPTETYGRYLEDHLLAFFSRHPELKSVKITVRDHLVEIAENEWITCKEKLMHCLLDFCPQLELLKVSSPRDVSGLTVDGSLYSKLLKSKLISLHLECFSLSIAAPLETKMLNYNLKHLDLCNSTPESIFLLAGKFCNLTHLHMGDVDDRSLQYIIQYQNCLRSLRIRGYSPRLTEYGFTGQNYLGGSEEQSTGYSISSLDKLQHFCFEYNIKDDVMSPAISERMLTQLKHLNIVYLNISVNQSSKISWKLSTNCVRMLSNFAQLEGLRFDNYEGSGIHSSLWVEVCSQLKKLQILKLTPTREDPPEEFTRYEEDADKWVNDAVEELFECCPTLRFITIEPAASDEGRYRTPQSYYCDPEKRKIVKSNTSMNGMELYPISPAKVDGFSVSTYYEKKGFWIWFHFKVCKSNKFSNFWENPYLYGFDF